MGGDTNVVTAVVVNDADYSDTIDPYNPQGDTDKFISADHFIIAAGMYVCTNRKINKQRRKNKTHISNVTHVVRDSCIREFFDV
jgi:hypothetical protein